MRISDWSSDVCSSDLLRHEASEIAWHTRHLYYRVNSPDPGVKARIVGQNEALQIMVYTQDRKDLFVTICRYCDRRSLSVQDARIHTTRHGWALDSFIVLLAAHEKDYRSNATLAEHELDEQLRRAPAAESTEPPGPRAWQPGSRRARVFPLLPNVELPPAQRSASWRLSIIERKRHG